LRRSRAWLQDKLWSDRPQEHGAASLRQCLTEIRSILREHPACFKTEAGWIGFDPDRVVVNSAPPDRDAGGDVEFLEGLDIRDPEFEHWLRDQRMSYSQSLDRSDAPKVKHQAAQEPGDFGVAAWAAELIQAHEAHIAALGRLLCRQALELEQLKVALRDASSEKRPISVRFGRGADLSMCRAPDKPSPDKRAGQRA
jgi:DNA-binding SARP family transcriptional activator